MWQTHLDSWFEPDSLASLSCQPWQTFKAPCFHVHWLLAFSTTVYGAGLHFPFCSQLEWYKYYHIMFLSCRTRQRFLSPDPSAWPSCWMWQRSLSSPTNQRFLSLDSSARPSTWVSSQPWWTCVHSWFEITRLLWHDTRRSTVSWSSACYALANHDHTFCIQDLLHFLLSALSFHPDLNWYYTRVVHKHHFTTCYYFGQCLDLPSWLDLVSLQCLASTFLWILGTP